MSIIVICDICGKKIIEIKANARWEMERYGEEIVCDECKEKYADFEEELQKLEESSIEKLEEEKESLRKKFFHKTTESNSDSMAEKANKERDDKEKKEPPRFRTLRK